MNQLPTLDWGFWNPTLDQQSLFEQWYQLILEVNRDINLTRITDPLDFWEKHLWDSLRGVHPESVKLDLSNAKIIDIGTGAGFPGMVVAIAHPNCQITLVDSIRKKINFVNQAISHLGISNTQTIIARAESIPHKYLSTYDIALIRAVGTPSLCAKYTLPLIKQGGIAILYRGQWNDQDHSELEDSLTKSGTKIEAIEQFITPVSNSLRHCVYLRKYESKSRLLISIKHQSPQKNDNINKNLPIKKESLMINYPHTPTVDQIDNYHGTLVSDPYRWLEDPHSEQTKTWIEAQNNITQNYLSQIPQRQSIKERLLKLWNYEKYSIPRLVKNRYFYLKNDGLQNQSVLYTLSSLTDEPKVLLDPNKLSEDGTIALSSWRISENGSFLAYGLSSAGSDWIEWYVLDIETGQNLSDHIKWVKFSDIAWTHDNQGFFYSRYDQPSDNANLEELNYYQKLYYHKLGQPQSEDILIYHRLDQKEWGFNPKVSHDGTYLIIDIWRGSESKNLIFYKELNNPNAEIKELFNDWSASYNYIGNNQTTFWFTTNLNAPKNRVISIDITDGVIQEIIPETHATLESTTIINHQLITQYLIDAHSQVKIFDLTGNFIKEIILPGIGSVAGFEGKPETTQTFYSYTSYTTPSTIYHYNFQTQESTIFRQPTIDFNPDEYQTEQIFYQSKDGTTIPMFITHKKSLIKNGNNPTYLYGYGGFNVSLTPTFSVSALTWLEMGGIYAIPNLRGGGEYGETWHEAGTKHLKQNVFDDFIAAAQWLIDQNYTKSEKLAIAGGSNGGLLVGACMTQRPDLFGAALPSVGVMDMLRFHKFTIGWAWVSDYGSSEDPQQFQTLLAYSPLHNIKPQTQYPPTLITTADHDDRVVPAHSFKFAATLQAAHIGDNPVLIRIETSAGHGAGKPTTKIIEEISDRWAFLVKLLKIN